MFVKLIIFFLVFSVSSRAQILETIPLPQSSLTRLESSDLMYQGKKLTPEQAFRLKESGVDLSMIDPESSSVWSPSKSPLIDDLDFKAGELVDYQGKIESAYGEYRFNITRGNHSDLLFHRATLRRDVHTLLLRRALMRSLGYKLPAVQYLKNLKVRFPDVQTRNVFLEESQVAVAGSISRWLKVNVLKDGYLDLSLLRDDQLTLEFQDLIVETPRPTDHYDLSNNPPCILKSSVGGSYCEAFSERVIKALIIPYSLVDFQESINKVSWQLGRISSQQIVLPNFSSYPLEPSFFDALWAMRRLAKLTRNDFENIVESAFFPEDVSKLIVEKVISRRNSLVELFNLKSEKLKFDSDINFGSTLREGRLRKIKRDDYAINFAGDNADSPLKDFEYFVYTKIQNSAFDALVSKVNSELSAFDPSKEKFEFIKKQFNDGLDHYVETGEFKDFEVGTWFSPTLDGNIILSRDIVLGNYLGTDNIVQLADTVGLAVSVGGVLGIENIDALPEASIAGNISAVRTYTHIKPVKSLKKSFEEPYKNLIVPLIKKKLSQKLKRIADHEAAEIDNPNTEISEDELERQRREILGDLIVDLNKFLGVGESLLVTDQITPALFASGKANIMETRVGLSFGTRAQIIRRLQIFRKDEQTIQVYEDKGKGFSFSYGLTVEHKIPIFRMTAESTKGDYQVKLHSISLNTNTDENPLLYKKLYALHELLETGSSDTLKKLERPYEIQTDFKDKSTKYSFLVWRGKYLKKDSEFSVYDKEGERFDYVSLSTESQEGLNYQDFTYSVANYLLKEFLRENEVEYNLEIARNEFQNPGQTIFGVSQSYIARFEGRKKERGMIDKAYMELVERNEGWSASSSKIRRMMNDINKRYQRDVFSSKSVLDTAGFKIFDVSVTTHIYERGIDKLTKLTRSQITSLKKKYISERSDQYKCQRNAGRNLSRLPNTWKECGQISYLGDKLDRCQERKNPNKKFYKCYLELAKMIHQEVEFNDFIKLIGEENILVTGVVNGFRKDSEILRDPIYSDTIGEVGSRYPHGPLQAVKQKLQISEGEFYGSWMREIL